MNKSELLKTNMELKQENASLKSERSGLMKQNQNFVSNIKKRLQELSEIEAKIGDDTTEGTLKYKIKQLKASEFGHNETLEKLKDEISAAQKEIGMFDEKGVVPKGSLRWEIDDLNKKIDNKEKEYKKTEADINAKVNIIKNVKDFKIEAVKNMWVYGIGMIAALILLIVLTCFAVSSISDTITLFRNQIGESLPNGIILRSTDWVIAALSIVIIKLPITLLFIGGMFFVYKLFSSLFRVYEKINNEKRKISTIEALINNLNEESVSILNGEAIDYDDPDTMQQAKDRIKWETISKYFESLPNDNLQNDSSIKAENDLLREIFIKSKKMGSITTPVASVAGSTETGK